jgi:predicted nucleic acid-binding Zn ribbon protein
MAKSKVRKRKRTTSEKVMLVLSVLIAISMILALFVSFGASTF